MNLRKHIGLWRRYVSPKCQFKPDPNGVTSQKTIFFTLYEITSLCVSASELILASQILCSCLKTFFVCLKLDMVVSNKMECLNVYIVVSDCMHMSAICCMHINSIVGWGTMLQAGRSQDRGPMRWIFSIHLIRPATLWPWDRLSL
jgi:hypothetical protein